VALGDFAVEMMLAEVQEGHAVGRASACADALDPARVSRAADP
jgi:hypothetical protein